MNIIRNSILKLRNKLRSKKPKYFIELAIHTNNGKLTSLYADIEDQVNIKQFDPRLPFHNFFEWANPKCVTDKKKRELLRRSKVFTFRDVENNIMILIYRKHISMVTISIKK